MLWPDVHLPLPWDLCRLTLVSDHVVPHCLHFPCRVGPCGITISSVLTCPELTPRSSRQVTSSLPGWRMVRLSSPCRQHIILLYCMFLHNILNTSYCKCSLPPHHLYNVPQLQVQNAIIKKESVYYAYQWKYKTRINPPKKINLKTNR